MFKKILDGVYFAAIKIKFCWFGLHIKYKSFKLRQINDEIKTIVEYRPDNIVKIQGGLGNQMFQYAFSKSLFGRVLYDCSIFNTYKTRAYALFGFNLDIKTTSSGILSDFAAENTVKEPVENIYCPEIISNNKVKYYDGFFQTEKYFQNYKKDLIRDFTAREPLTQEYRDVLKKIENSNSCLVNFRVAGDYVKFGHVLDVKYQMEAMDYIASRVLNPEFFVFGDDIEKIKSIFKPQYPVNYVDIGAKNQNKMFFDLELMKKCKHAILCNSSFSWWAGWLNENPDKIIVAPDPWLTGNEDTLCADWHLIKANQA